MEPSNLALFWAVVLACSIMIYVLLDGFDLGVGVLFGTTQSEAHRVQMMNTIAPFWDGNETWLVVTGAGLFAAFPDVYAVFLGAFAAVGAMMRGIPVADGQYTGGPFGWLHPFTILTGIGLVLGYALLGAGWLVLKGEGKLRDWAHRRIRWLAASVLAVLIVAFTVTFDYSVLARSNLYAKPWALVFPVIGAFALAGIAAGVGRQRDGLPFAMTALFFLASFLTLGAMFWPYMIPYSLTVAGTAAPDASLRFFFYGGIVVLPVIVAYTIGKYWVFRGKVDRGYG